KGLVGDDLSSRINERSPVNLDGHRIDHDRFNSTSIGDLSSYLKRLVEPHDRIRGRLIDRENWLCRSRWHTRHSIPPLSTLQQGRKRDPWRLCLAADCLQVDGDCGYRVRKANLNGVSKTASFQNGLALAGGSWIIRLPGVRFVRRLPQPP